MEKKIIRMECGLANRMFQYSYGLYLGKKGYDIYYDNSYRPKKLKTENIDWNKIFPKATIKQVSLFETLWYGAGFDLISKIRYHYLPWSCNLARMKSAFLIPSEDEIMKKKCFIGFFQNSTFIDEIKNEVQNIFTFSPFQEGSNNFLLSKKMLSENSVAVHFRKGKDYLAMNIFKDTCPIEYYIKAINHIKQHIENPVFYVFTDNQEWVRNNLKEFDYILVQNNPASGWGNHFDMQLMSYCKHNIIANSTYSWWGAYLNLNPNKIVIGPKRWFNPISEEYNNTHNKILCKDWIHL